MKPTKKVQDTGNEYMTMRKWGESGKHFKQGTWETSQPSLSCCGPHLDWACNDDDMASLCSHAVIINTLILQSWQAIIYSRWHPYIDTMFRTWIWSLEMAHETGLRPTQACMYTSYTLFSVFALSTALHYYSHSPAKELCASVTVTWFVFALP